MKLLNSAVLFLALTFAASGSEDVWNHRKLVMAQANGIDNQYIVVLKNGTGTDIFSLLAALPTPTTKSGTKSIVYPLKLGMKGGVMSDVQLPQLMELLNSPDVAYVEQDRVVTTDTVQKPAPWGLDYVDNPKVNLDNKYQYKFTGMGVDVFVLDTGMLVSHDEFGGRASCGFTAFDGDNCVDDYNHGTHVAGTIGGKTYGPAKNANLISVKVLGGPGGEGTTSTVLQGIEYVIGQKNLNPGKPMVANLSMGTPTSEAMNDAVSKAVEAGVVVVTSAGNDSADACNQSPASSEFAITVAALTKSDNKASYSNYGTCVSIFAPGDSIKSASSGSTSATRYESGTSMAAPLVTGVIALYLEQDPNSTPEQVRNKITDDSVAGIVADTLNSPNLVVSTEVLNNIGISSAATCSKIFKPCFDDNECCSGHCRMFGRCFI